MSYLTTLYQPDLLEGVGLLTGLNGRRRELFLAKETQLNLCSRQLNEFDCDGCTSCKSLEECVIMWDKLCERSWGKKLQKGVN